MGSLLAEEIRRKSMDGNKQDAALNVQRGRSQFRGESQERGKSRSKSRARNIECYHCGKKGHMKKDCYKMKREQKDKKKNANWVANQKEESPREDKGKVKIEEINAVTHDSDNDVLFMSSLSAELLTTSDDAYSQDWILDSGTSFHVTPHGEWFSTYDSGKTGCVHLGNDYACDIVGVGDIKFSFANGSAFILKHVRHVPKLTKSLISVGQLDDAGFHTTFGFQSWKIQKGSMLLARGAKCGTLYPLHVSGVFDHVVAITEQPSTSLWHYKLGHISQIGMKLLCRLGYVPHLSFSDFEFCEHYLYGNQSKSAHKRRGKKEFEKFDLVHSDVCGPMPTRSLGGAEYYVRFIDDATRKV